MNRTMLVVSVLLTGMTASATVYWQGGASVEGHWSATDNPKSGSDGYYWNTTADGTGTWQVLPVNENAMIQHGGTVCIDGDDGTVDYVQKLVLDFQKNKSSCLRLDAGGVLTNVVVYVGHGSGSSGPLFHVNGGQAWIGRGSEGLMVPSSSAKRSSGGSFSARVSSGMLDVSGSFSVAGTDQDGYANTGTVTIDGGAVTSHCNVVVGVDSETCANVGSIDLSAGSLAVETGKAVQLYHNASLTQTGGHADLPTLTVKGGAATFSGGTASVGQLDYQSGGEVTVGGTSVVAVGLDLSDDEVATGNENLFTVNGGALTITSVASGYAFLNPVNPFRLHQTGGAVNLEKLYVGEGASGLLKLEIDGGSLTCGKIATFGQPFYLRHRGAATVGFDEFTANTSLNKNNCATNCLVEHVIACGTVKPLTFNTGRRVFGYNVLRPEGGVQLMATNRFALFQFTGTATLTESYRSGVPAEDLWTSKKFSDANEWGSTLKTAACVGTMQGRRFESSFSAVPAGYISLPSIATNRLLSFSVELTVEPQAASLEELREGLEGAGYQNVRALSGNVLAFDVPCERVPNQSATAALVFDFRETPCPTAFTATPMTFETKTNALVTAAKVSMSRSVGLAIIYR